MRKATCRLGRVGLMLAAALMTHVAVDQPTASAQVVVKPRTIEVLAGENFMPLSLAPVVNTKGLPGMPESATKINVGNIPFELLPGDLNHLYLKPIGWSAAKDESREYPGYIAKYDTKPVYDSTKPADPTRAILKVPVDDYAAIWLLAATDDDTLLSDKITFRIGVIDGQARLVYHDFEGTVPRASEKRIRGDAISIIPNGDKSLFLVRVPIGKAIAQDFKDRRMLDLDITKELNVAITKPDSYRYQYRPLGLPSGVRIYGMTLEHAPFQLEVNGTEPGNAFNLPNKPTFDLTLHTTSGDRTLGYSVIADVTRDDGVTETLDLVTFKNPYSKYHTNGTEFEKIEFPKMEPGQYRVRFRLMRGKQEVLVRETTFAVLAPDTRKFVKDNPFGTWDFGGVHYSPRDHNMRLSLAKKLGLKYMMYDKKEGMESYRAPRMSSRKQVEDLKKQLAADPSLERPKEFLIFHETAVSGPHITRTIDAFTGKTYKFNESEQKTFDKLWAEASETYAALQEHFPEADVLFGNGGPQIVEEFLRRGFDPKVLKIAGNESGSFMRPPEAQPPDFVSNNGGLFNFRTILDHYGYKDTRLEQCFEMCYPNTNPGNLKEHTQANYLVRHLMHSLAWGVPKITPLCLADMGNSYYHANWGATGLLYAMPNATPKPSFVAYAVTTQILDGMKFKRFIPTGTASLYANEFTGQGRVVTCLWTSRGERAVTLTFPAGTKVKVTNLMGREVPLVVHSKGYVITASETPVWVESSAASTGLQVGLPSHPAHDPLDKPAVLSPMADAGEWSVVKTPSQEMEVYNFMTPRQQGDLKVEAVDVFDGKSNILKLTPSFRANANKYLPMYAQMKAAKPIAIPGEPTEIGVWVQGNSGWGRVIFELEDASGQRWVSIGAEQEGEPNQWMADWLTKEEFEKLRNKGGLMGVDDWNSNDPWGRSTINHDGWRFVRYPLPGNYPGDGYHWPYNSQWRATGGKPETRGKVVYPLKLTGLTITAPMNVLYLNEFKPVGRQEFYVKDLSVTYRPLEVVSKGE